jgi:hypothetical protein
MISRVLICLLLVSATLALKDSDYPFIECDNLDKSYISIEGLEVSPVNPTRGNEIVFTFQVKGTASSAVLVDSVVS